MSTTPLVFAWPEGLVFWLIIIWFYIPEIRVLRSPTGMKGKSAQDAGSIKLIMAGGQVAGLGSFAAPFLFPGATITYERVAVYALGILLIIGAGFLRRHCFRMLGENFTGLVIVKANQPIVERGAYKWLRHPSYTAAYILYLGLGLALTNWVSIVVSLLSAAVMYTYRISVEERALVETLGEQYVAYQRRTKKIIPFVY